MKKVLSILLAVLMLASLCTIAVSAEETATPTWADLGVYDGTGVTYGSIVEFEGEWVIKMGTGNSNYNLRLADPADPTQPFTVTAGTVYTVKFDYYINVNIGWQIRPMKHPTTPEQRGSALSTTNSGISNSYVGDGKWHTGSKTFTAATPTGGGVTLDNIGLLYQNTTGASGYIKNIEIITETYPVSYARGKYDFGVYFDETGTPKADLFHETVKHNVAGASLMTGSYVNAAGETVFVPTNDNAPVTNGTRVIEAYDCIDVLNASAAQVKMGSHSEEDHPTTYAYIVLKYKVNKIGESGKATIGVGRASSTDGWTCLFKSVDVTEASDEWQYLTFKLVNEGNYVFRIVLGGVGSEIAIESFEYAHTVYNENVVAVFISDNGVMSTYLGYKGTDFIHNVGEGANAENLAMGEKFLGWYSDANFTTEATKLPETNGVLFAKYPTVILDNFNAVELYTSGNEKYSTTVTHNHNGTITSASNSNGSFRIPAYDAPATDGYKFPAGQKFLVNFYYKSIAIAGEGAESANIQFIPGERYGSGYYRKGTGIFSATVTATEEPGVISKVITNGTYSNTAGEPVETLLYRGHDDSTVTSTVVIDKITITSLADVEPIEEKDMVAVSTRAASGSGAEYVSAGIRFKAKVTEEFRASATEMGFYAVPTAALNGMSLADYVETADNIALSAKVMGEGMDEIIYAVSTDDYGRKTYDYQMIITGLTHEGYEKTMLNTKITTALYAIVNGEMVFTEEVSYSYNDVTPAQ